MSINRPECMHNADSIQVGSWTFPNATYKLIEKLIVESNKAIAVDRFAVLVFHRPLGSLR